MTGFEKYICNYIYIPYTYHALYIMIVSHQKSCENITNIPFFAITLSTREGENPIPIKFDLRLLPEELATLS